MPRHKIIALIIMSFFVHVIPVKAIQDIYTPDILDPWQKWVLYDKQEYHCPFEYNNHQKRHCDWITHLDLDLNKNKSHFYMKGILFKEQYVFLPGQNGCWPDNVNQKNKYLAVIPFKNHPAVLLSEGPFEISGSFLYDRLPESVSIPSQVGLLTLRMNGKHIKDPFFSKDHRLWLRTGHTKGPSGNRMHVQVYRLITDCIPMTMTHHLQLSVSGNSREEIFNHVLPEKSIVMSIDSPLPIQLEDNKNIRLHVRTGQWTIKIVSRFTDQRNHLKANFLIRDNEIWSFQSQTHLRMVKIIGVAGIDPASSGVPHEWQKYPAYEIHRDESVTFQEQQRGDPDPSPDQLSLNRNLWLDFDGNGYTIHDKIQGTINQNWRLNMDAPIQLGRVSFSEKDQLLTQYNDQSGVEIRTGHLNMTADARYTNCLSTIPAIGWDHSMNRVHAQINLPPGWRILSVFGVDIVRGSWLGQWRLLDLFLALLIGMAIYHLINIKWAIMAWITMVLTFHEPSAPHLTWLHLLAVIALLNVVPQGRFHALMRVWFIFAVILISIFVLPFMMYQIQSGIFPQLERQVRTGSGTFIHSRSVVDQGPRTESQKSIFLGKSRNRLPSSAMQKSKERSYPRQAVSDAVIQTGPGLPEWKWKSLQLQWNGPVDKTQQFRLWLIPPFLNGVLAIIRVMLVSLLLFVIGKCFSKECSENKFPI
jgi:hypothetical protein